MPRMRTIKPQACTSETLTNVPREVRWTFATFWTHCDDEGRAAWNLRLIKAALYPLDDDVTLDVLAVEFDKLEGIGAVCRYTVDGKEYVHVPSWPEHQHPNRKVSSNLPECPRSEHGVTPHVRLTADAVSEPGPLTAVVVVGDVDGGEMEAGRDSATAQTLVSEWVDHCAKRPPGQVIGQVGKSLDRMLAEGLDPADVRRGLAAWHTKGLSPSVLPSVVNEVMNAAPMSRNQAETDALFERAAKRLGVAQ